MKNIRRSINAPCPGMYFDYFNGVEYKSVNSMRAIMQDSVINFIWAPVRSVSKRVVKNNIVNSNSNNSNSNSNSNSNIQLK